MGEFEGIGAYITSFACDISSEARSGDPHEIDYRNNLQLGFKTKCMLVNLSTYKNKHGT